MDLLAMRTRCEERFRDPANDIVTAAEWDSYLNEAYSDVQSQTDLWPSYEATADVTVSAGTASPTITDEPWTVRSVFNVTDDIVMTPLSGLTTPIRRFGDGAGPTPDASDQGEPRWYRMFGKSLEVFPRPAKDTTIRVEYTASLVEELSLDGDVPTHLPQSFHRMLIEGALARAYEDDGNANQARLHWDHYMTYLRRLPGHLLMSRTESNVPIMDTLWS